MRSVQNKLSDYGTKAYPFINEDNVFCVDQEWTNSAAFSEREVQMRYINKQWYRYVEDELGYGTLELAYKGTGIYDVDEEVRKKVMKGRAK